MMWRACTLGDLVSLQRGYDLTEAQRNQGSVPVIGSNGRNGWHDKARAAGPGVTVGRSGASAGVVTYVSEEYWPHNTVLFVTDFKGCDPRFIAYLLSTLNLASFNSGSAQPSLNRNFLYSIPTKAPPYHLQHRIALVLSAYDDLIENNTRRIAILEEMARCIFEEWFVNFRAPGCEGAPLVESPLGPIPQGWELARLGDILDLKYGKALKADRREGGSYPVYGSSGVVGAHSSALVEGPGIVVGRKGNVGSVHWSERSFFPIDTAFFVTTELPFDYVYHLLRQQRFLNSDAAVPGLNRTQALSMEVVRPPTDLIELMAAMLRPTRGLVEVLNSQNANLRDQRDLLLPKLISGEIDVSAAEGIIREAAE